MIKLIIKILTLFIATLLIMVIFNKVFVERYGYIYMDGASIIKLKKRDFLRNNIWKKETTKKSVLVFGNSKIFAGFVPAVFDNALGNKTYTINLALPATPLYTNYFLLEDYLKNNNAPDFIITTLPIFSKGGGNEIFLRYSMMGASFAEITDYAFMGEFLVPFYYFFSMKVFESSFNHYLTNYFFNYKNISEQKAKNNVNIQQMLINRGYYYISEQSRFPDGRLPANFTEGLNPGISPPQFDISQDKYLFKFFDFCKKYNIKILLINEPERMHRFSQYNDISFHFKQLLSLYDNVYLSTKGYKSKFYPNTKFSDPTHLNQEGAREYTSEIAFEFKECFE